MDTDTNLTEMESWSVSKHPRSTALSLMSKEWPLLAIPIRTILEVSARVFWPSAFALNFSIKASMVILT